jgi:hypothetical protein
VQALGGGEFSVTGSHTYAEEGAASVTVTISDAPLTSRAVLSPATIADAPLTPIPVTAHADENQPFSGEVARFSDPGTDGTTADYSATITWPDGSTSPGAIALVSGQVFSVAGGHTFSEGGSLPIAVLVVDVGGARTVVNSTAAVADLPLTARGAAEPLHGREPGVLEPGEATSGTLATFTDADPRGTIGDYRATIDWGDGTTSAGTVGGPVAGPWTVSGTHQYQEDGEFGITVTITAVGGATAIARSRAVIDDPSNPIDRLIDQVEDAVP